MKLSERFGALAQAPWAAESGQAGPLVSGDPQGRPASGTGPLGSQQSLKFLRPMAWLAGLVNMGPRRHL
eukprot:2514805-Pyramimonas_sp.AAC.1